MVPCWAGHQRVSVSGPTTRLVVKVRNRAVNGWGTACYAVIFFQFPRLNSHSHVNPMGLMGSQSFPFPCTPLFSMHDLCLCNIQRSALSGTNRLYNSTCSAISQCDRLRRNMKSNCKTHRVSFRDCGLWKIPGVISDI